MITPSFGLTATERVLPKLALDFTTASLDPRVTFTRTGNTATVTNSLGLIAPINADLPRFDFDPVTLACKGLLIEETRINLTTYSADFSNPTWVNTNVTITSDSIISPDGALTGDTVTLTSGTGILGSVQNTTVTTSNTVVYTASIYAKKGTHSFIQLVPNGVAAFANFDLNAGTIGSSSGLTATMTLVGNGWYRCTITFTASLSAAYLRICGVASSTAARLATWNPTGTETYYVWGAQLETGAFATSYIPTTTTALTRNADVATMTGTNFSDWFNASEGTFVLQNQYPDVPTGTGRVPVSINTDASNFMQIYTRLGTINGALGQVAASTQWVNAGSTASTAIFKTAFAYKLNDIQMATNGANVFTDNVATIPTVNQLVFPSGNCGYVQKLNYYPMRLTSAEVIAFSKQ